MTVGLKFSWHILNGCIKNPGSFLGFDLPNLSRLLFCEQYLIYCSIFYDLNDPANILSSYISPKGSTILTCTHRCTSRVLLHVQLLPLNPPGLGYSCRVKNRRHNPLEFIFSLSNSYLGWNMLQSRLSVHSPPHPHTLEKKTNIYLKYITVCFSRNMALQYYYFLLIPIIW